MKRKLKLLICMLLSFYVSCAQLAQYSYRHEIKNVTEKWHRLTLPAEVFSHVAPDLRDLRIFGITTSNDTLEVPFILQQKSGQPVNQKVAFKLLNSTFRQDTSFFTLEIPSEETISEIHLHFEQKNFDWRAFLEGSHDQRIWYSYQNTYRLASIQNASVDFSYTRLLIPPSKYRYYKIGITGKERPTLLKADISLETNSAAVFNYHKVKNLKINHNIKDKTTSVDVELNMPLPVSMLKLQVSDSVDYFRRYIFQVFKDSIKAPKGWIENYNIIGSGVLSSIDSNHIQSSNSISNKFRIIIYNADNKLLSIHQVKVAGYAYHLVARFDHAAAYYLAYGNPKASKPSYDIENFKGNIPQSPVEVKVGILQKIQNKKAEVGSKLNLNKTGLWLLMVLIMVTLGWFSWGLLQKK